MRPHPLTILALVWTAAALPAVARPIVVTTRFATPDVVIATEVVRPPATGVDAAPAIQGAIDRVNAAGGGVVFLPAGRYRLGRPILVRDGVAIRGDWTPPTHAGWEQGTLLMPVADRGRADGPPAISLTSNCGIRNLAIWYPDQQASDPVPYPWAIGLLRPKVGSNANPTVMNVTLVNPYRGIQVGPHCNFLFMVREVYGTPLDVGLSVDTCVDIGRIHNVRFSPRWWCRARLPGAPADPASARALRLRLLEGATGIDLGRDEWGYLYGCEIEGYRTGYRFRPGDGNMNGALYRCHAVRCRTAVRLSAAIPPLGLSFAGCRFDSYDATLEVDPAASGSVQFSACKLASAGCQAVNSHGDVGLSLMDCDLQRWVEVAIRMDRGSLTLTDCRFGQPGSHVILGRQVERALLAGNRFPGKPGIRADSPATDLQVSPAQLGTPPITTPALRIPPDPHPASRRAWLVGDYGASPHVADNTAAFARALRAAGRAGGGTVYVPAGIYRLTGALRVPTGVELRGLFDTPHHTLWAGSALLTTWGRSKPEATPFIQLGPRSGLRGLTIWYPDQNRGRVVPYPWAVRSLGPRCWVMHTNIANAYRGVDFASHPSDGHLVRYLAGACYSEGLRVGRCQGGGCIDDIHMNPHFAFWTDPRITPVDEKRFWNATVDRVRRDLVGVWLGDCHDEQVLSVFFYAARDGLSLQDQAGAGPSACVVHLGVDNGQRCLLLDSPHMGRVTLANTQMVPLGKWVQAGVVATPRSRGAVAMANSAIWNAGLAVDLRGKTDLLMQGLVNTSGPVRVASGSCTLQALRSLISRSPDVTVGRGGRALMVACTGAANALRVAAGGQASGVANSLDRTYAPPVGDADWSASWREGQAMPTNAAMSEGVTELECRTTGAGLELRGNSTRQDHSYAYLPVAQTNVAVYADTLLTYSVRADNAAGRHAGLDLSFADGSAMRETPAATLDGIKAHPTEIKGPVGKWVRMAVPLGRYSAGRTVSGVSFAFDARGVTGPFAATVRGLSIRSELAGADSATTIAPAPGSYPTPLRVRIALPANQTARYTLNGMAPTVASPRVNGAILLARPGLYDLRVQLCGPDGSPTGAVIGRIYQVTPRGKHP